MADPYLKGNGVACQVCGPIPAGWMRPRWMRLGYPGPPGFAPCNHCAGSGREPIPPAQIVAAQIAENQRKRKE